MIRLYHRLRCLFGLHETYWYGHRRGHYALVRRHRCCWCPFERVEVIPYVLVTFKRGQWKKEKVQA